MEKLPPIEPYQPSPEEVQKAEAMMPEELKSERAAENENYDREVGDTVAALYERHGGEAYDALSPKYQDEWYWLEMEAQIAPSEEAKNNLKNFLALLDGLRGIE